MATTKVTLNVEFDDVVISMFTDWSMTAGEDEIGLASYHLYVRKNNSFATHVMHRAATKFIEDNSSMIELLGLDEEQVVVLVHKLIKREVKRIGKLD